MCWIKMCSTSIWFQAIAVLSLGLKILAQNDLTVCDNPCPLCPVFVPDLHFAYYPLVNGDTSEFVYCNYAADNETSYQVYTCPTGFVFSPRTIPEDTRPLCVPARPAQGAAGSGCSGQNNVNVSCYGVPSFFCTCTNGRGTSLHQCPVGQIFDNRTKACEVKCTQSGIFGYSAIEEPVALTEYYTCLFNDTTWLYTMNIYTCPQDTTFNSAYSFCLPPNVEGNTDANEVT